MENDENVAKKKYPTGLHSTQSQPIIFGAAGSGDDEGTSGAQSNTSKADAQKEHVKNRRVSFASSSQLTQYLEPINPFESFGEFCTAAVRKCNFPLSLSSSSRCLIYSNSNCKCTGIVMSVSIIL